MNPVYFPIILFAAKMIREMIVALRFFIKTVLSLRPSVMDDNLYDEFGVYLGPDLDDDDELSDHEVEAGEAGTTGDEAGGARMDIGM